MCAPATQQQKITLKAARAQNQNHTDRFPRHYPTKSFGDVSGTEVVNAKVNPDNSATSHMAPHPIPGHTHASPSPEQDSLSPTPAPQIAVSAKTPPHPQPTERACHSHQDQHESSTFTTTPSVTRRKEVPTHKEATCQPEGPVAQMEIEPKKTTQQYMRPPKANTPGNLPQGRTPSTPSLPRQPEEKSSQPQSATPQNP